VAVIEQAPPDPRTTGRQVDRLLEQLQSSPDPRAAGVAEDLVRSLVQLYGAGLARIVALVGADRARDLCADPLVESLLLVHDLHPLDVDTRIRRALDRARPLLGSRTTGLDHLGVDADGVAHVRVTGAGRGCGSSASAVEQTIADAIADAAPETSGVDVVVAPPPLPLLQISRRP
jgi:Fe-S cluster biogenesis protein NfuA